MLVIRGKLLKQIFSDHWSDFVTQHSGQIRSSIHKNVEKMLKCGTEEMGFHQYQCPNCQYEKKVPHTCKSRFCTKCGVAQTDIWIERYTTLFTNCQYQHVIFSPPEQFRKYFGIGKKPYYDYLYIAVNQTLKDWYTRKGYLPGIMNVMHTFGRDIKYHVHIHVLITCGGLDRVVISAKSEQVLRSRVSTRCMTSSPRTLPVYRTLGPSKRATEASFHRAVG